MFKTIEEFTAEWSYETAATSSLMAAMTDESLNQRIGTENRTLGRLASHLVVSIHEMLTRTGLKFECPITYDHVPVSASSIAVAYKKVSEVMLQAVRAQWNDETLLEQHNMYGEEWSNAVTLRVLIQHEVHHRGQMTVLMRQAGFRIPGMYGPTMEDWGDWGMEAPVV
jgi:uncharacterized damage-inducible protein DinB